MGMPFSNYAMGDSDPQAKDELARYAWSNEIVTASDLEQLSIPQGWR
jgi:hypothetical protein